MAVTLAQNPEVTQYLQVSANRKHDDIRMERGRAGGIKNRLNLGSSCILIIIFINLNASHKTMCSLARVIRGLYLWVTTNIPEYPIEEVLA